MRSAQFIEPDPRPETGPKLAKTKTTIIMFMADSQRQNLKFEGARCISRSVTSVNVESTVLGPK